ncbi:MOSC and FAD-binding oxidoreductase domain-containing protein [Granulicella sp. L60]|uniref:MOSC and FAD-binding oxidoreductase domain-containing protein n=1 Tax=Granulicella sp. L60 TaxID=1641866 RepID=UPI0020B126C0|nr:MOSC and FAD-binding oxidoreductase domain-containing protein [Granulicella sp. L60]
MVYQLDSYRYWEKFLQRSGLEYGQFGENFTVDGLADNEVCIGDHYRIGGALFEVTQPRVTCYRVGIRMNDPQMPSLLVSHKRPGFYFRVLEEGEVGAGDEIVRVAEGPERVSIEEIDGLLYLPGHPLESLRRALRVPALSFGWKQSLEALAEAGKQQEPYGNAGLAPSSTPAPAWSGFRPLRVANIQRESVDVLSFVFESEDHSPLLSAIPGQFLALRLPVDSHTAPLVRNYSISNFEDVGRYRISVKRAAGSGSHYLHDQVKSGDIIHVSAPRGEFAVAPGANPVVLISAGIGVTPVLAMLHSLAASQSGKTREVWWCYGTRNGEEHPFASEVKGLLEGFSRSHSFVAYSRPADDDRGYDASGHLNLSALQRLGIPEEADFYLCGPAAFLADFIADLNTWGVPGTRIHSETFGAGAALTPGIASKPSLSPHPPKGSAGIGPLVSFTRSSLVAPWDSRYGNLLEFAEACDVPVRWSCRVGVCHTCESGLIDGKVRYIPEPLDQPASGDVLICCSSPLTAIELDL